MEPTDRARRIRPFCDAYGLPDRANLLGVVRARQAFTREFIRREAGLGDPGFAKIWSWGAGTLILRDLEHLDHHRRELETPLQSALP